MMSPEKILSESIQVLRGLKQLVSRVAYNFDAFILNITLIMLFSARASSCSKWKKTSKNPLTCLPLNIDKYTGYIQFSSVQFSFIHI